MLLQHEYLIFVYGLIMIFDASSAYLDTRYVIFKEVKDKTNQCLLSVIGLKLLKETVSTIRLGIFS